MKNKTVLVTGGTRGIGAAISKNFLEQNATVIAVATSEKSCSKWLTEMQQAGFKKAETKICDVADFAACQKMVASIITKHRRVDVLINNAGITRDTSLKKMTKENWDQVLHINLDSMFNVTKPVLDIMLEHNFGRIINLSSVNAQKGQFGQTNYAATKAGIHGFTKSLALETARKNITVNTVSPGYINTEMMADIPAEILAKIVEQVPVGRLGEVDEVARVITFLAAVESGYITGSNVSINGGLHMY